MILTFLFWLFDDKWKTFVWGSMHSSEIDFVNVSNILVIFLKFDSLIYYPIQYCLILGRRVDGQQQILRLLSKLKNPLPTYNCHCRNIPVDNVCTCILQVWSRGSKDYPEVDPWLSHYYSNIFSIQILSWSWPIVFSQLWSLDWALLLWPLGHCAVAGAEILETILTSPPLHL